jgi:hypothetical protein
MLYEMREPKDFVTALNITIPLLFVTYTLTGAVGWYLAGENVTAYLLDMIPSGPLRSFASVLLIFHIVFNMIPKTQIVNRVLHHKIDAASVDAFHRKSEMFWRATRSWFLISVFLFAATFLVVNMVPYFNDLVVLLGSLLTPITSWIIPTSLYWLFLGKKERPVPILMKFICFFLALLCAGLMTFGTTGAVIDWLGRTANIFRCNA